MLKVIVFAVIGLVAVVLIFAATRPDTLHVERSAAIKATPEKLFALSNDFHQWQA